MNTEVIDGMSNAAYHAHPALGSTSLKTLATKTPAHFKWQSENRIDKPEFDLGTVVHSLVLEQDESLIAVIDADSWRTKKAKEEGEAARAEGKTPLLVKDWQQAKAMRDAIMAHPLAKVAFSGHIAERSVFWEEDGLALKTRPDALNKGLILDLKTARTADPRNFGKVAADYGYHQSAAHYKDGMKVATGDDLPFLFVLAEKEPPYLPAVVELHPDAIELGRALNDRAKRIYRECLSADNWPGYPESDLIELPKWATYQAEELLNV